MGATLRLEIFPADLDATADFYTQVLGFSLVRDERTLESAYLALQRDAMQIGAAQRPEPTDRAHRRPTTGVEIVIEVDDLDGDHARVVRSGWPLEENLTARPWGLRDFRVLDPNGYYLRVTEHSTPASHQVRNEEGKAAQ